MSAIGKIFIVLNLVFSLVIVGAAASYLSKADDWKKLHDELETTYQNEKADWEQQLSDNRASINNLQTEADDKQSRIEDLEVANGNLRDRVESEVTSNSQLRNSVDQIQNDLADFSRLNNDLRTRNNELGDQNNQLSNAARDAQEKQRQAEEDLLRKEGDLKRANERVSGLELSLAGIEQEKGHLESLLQVAQSKGFDISELVAMRKVDARIVEVDNELGFVLLSVGKDDEVVKGWTFQVYRDKQYLGEVMVDEVYDKYSAARIKFTAKGAEFKIHDSATTIL